VIDILSNKHDGNAVGPNLRGKCLWLMEAGFARAAPHSQQGARGNFWMQLSSAVDGPKSVGDKIGSTPSPVDQGEPRVSLTQDSPGLTRLRAALP
jgi:hypothetical protein